MVCQESGIEDSPKYQQKKQPKTGKSRRQYLYQVDCLTRSGFVVAPGDVPPVVFGAGDVPFSRPNFTYHVNSKSNSPLSTQFQCADCNASNVPACLRKLSNMFPPLRALGLIGINNFHEGGRRMVIDQRYAKELLINIVVDIMDSGATAAIGIYCSLDANHVGTRVKASQYQTSLAEAAWFRCLVHQSDPAAAQQKRSYQVNLGLLHTDTAAW